MKGKYVVMIVVALLLLVSGTRFISMYIAKKEIKDATMDHLITEKEYQTSDIADMYVVNVGNNELHYAAVVTFKDEIDVDYIYGFIGDTGQIGQINIVNKGHRDTFKHRESS
jgi:hypothetical protein